jgi:hypothetical protein
MYYHFPTTGTIQQLSKADAIKKMDEICEQWEDENNTLGKLFMGVFDWDFKESKNGIEMNIPHLADGGSIPKNEKASKLFGFDIYGDCFLLPDPNKLSEINTLITALQ